MTQTQTSASAQDADAKRLAQALAGLLAAGLPQDGAVLDYAAQSFGAQDAADLAGLLHDRDEACAGPLFCLMLSPGQATREAAEPLLAELRLDEAGAFAAADRLEGLQGAATFELPGGGRLTSPLAPGDAWAFVTALRPWANAPEAVDGVLAGRYTAPDATPLRVALRRSDPAWTAERAAFVAALLAGLAHAPSLALPTLEWALGFFAATDPAAGLETALAERRRTLSALLGRVSAIETLWETNSFETLAMQGARPPHLHAPDLRREMALLDRAAAAAGLDAGRSETVFEQDLGDCRDPEALLKLLGG